MGQGMTAQLRRRGALVGRLVAAFGVYVWVWGALHARWVRANCALGCLVFIVCVPSRLARLLSDSHFCASVLLGLGAWHGMWLSASSPGLLVFGNGVAGVVSSWWLRSGQSGPWRNTLMLSKRVAPGLVRSAILLVCLSHCGVRVCALGVGGWLGGAGRIPMGPGCCCLVARGGRCERPGSQSCFIACLRAWVQRRLSLFACSPTCLVGIFPALMGCGSCVVAQALPQTVVLHARRCAHGRHALCYEFAQTAHIARVSFQRAHWSGRCFWVGAGLSQLGACGCWVCASAASLSPLECGIRGTRSSGIHDIFGCASIMCRDQRSCLAPHALALAGMLL